MPSRSIASTILVLGVSGCTMLVDEYAVGSGGGEDVDPAVENPCGDDEVLTDDGECARVGVEACDEGFAADEDGACRAVLPAQDCEDGVAYPGTPGCVDAASACGADGYPELGSRSPEDVVFVDAAAATGGCGSLGTRECPYPTIGAALEAVAGRASPIVYLKNGRYEGNVTIVTSNVWLHGCGEAEIGGKLENFEPSHPCFVVGLDPTLSAAICVAPGVTRTRIDGVRVTGESIGVRVLGGELTLSSSQIHATGGYGLDVRESIASFVDPHPVRASVNLERVGISGASGIGIHVIGSDLEVHESSIQLTRMINEAPDIVPGSEEQRLGLARGIALYPSGWSSTGELVPAAFTRSSARIDKTAVTGNAEIGIFATGTDLEITGSFIGSLRDGAASGRGLVVERSLAVGASTSARVETSVIERTYDAAIDVRDAMLELTSSTIRSPLGRRGDGCTGQGIRVRSLPPGDARSDVTVSRSSILDSRQAGIFAASSTVRLESTLIRGAAPVGTEGDCASVMGDGISLEDYPDEPPAELTVDRVRVEGATRAAIAAVSSGPTITESVLACSGGGLVQASGREVSSPVGAICGCGAEWHACAYEPRTLAPWAVPVASAAWPERSNSAFYCYTPVFPGDVPLSGVALWSLLAPELVPRLSEEDGCVRLGGLVQGLNMLTSSRPGFLSAEFALYPRQPNILHRGSMLLGELEPWAASGWPFGIPVISLSDVPAGSLVLSDPPGTLVNLGGTPLTDGRVGDDGRAILGLQTGGWYTVTIVPPPGVECQFSYRDPAGVARTVRHLRVEQGAMQLTSFGNCVANAP